MSVIDPPADINVFWRQPAVAAVGVSGDIEFQVPYGGPGNRS